MEMKLCSYKGIYSVYEKEVKPVEETGKIDVAGRTQPWFKPKNGSLFPVKRRSVKRMMFDSAVQFFGSDCVKTVPLKVANSKERQQVNLLPVKSVKTS